LSLLAACLPGCVRAQCRGPVFYFAISLLGRWAWYLPRWAHRVLPEVSLGPA
jgi:hypothetical protein